MVKLEVFSFTGAQKIRRYFYTVRRPFRFTSLQFLNAWVQKIRGLGLGQVAMAPCGWIRADGSGHAVAFVVMRQAEDRFSVSIVNPCGEGAEYHAKEADPVRGKVRFVERCQRKI